MATHKSILAFYREFLNDPGWHEDAYMLWEVIDRGIQYYDGEEYAKTADI